jgi:hypothetical protein
LGEDGIDERSKPHFNVTEIRPLICGVDTTTNMAGLSDRDAQDLNRAEIVDYIVQISTADRFEEIAPEYVSTSVRRGWHDLARRCK